MNDAQRIAVDTASMNCEGRIDILRNEVEKVERELHRKQRLLKEEEDRLAALREGLDA